MSQVCYRPFIVSRHPLLGESAATRGRRAVVLAPGQLYRPLSGCDPRVRCSPRSRRTAAGTGWVSRPPRLAGAVVVEKRG